MVAPDDPMRDEDVATVLEFFGIKLTTPNERFAQLLTTDVGDLFQHGVREAASKVTGGSAKDLPGRDTDVPGWDET